jgi:hypothetical protein
VALPVAREKLALESRNVHADRTLGLTSAALQTEVENVVHVVVTEP